MGEEFDFSIVGGDGDSPVDLHVNVSDRERRRYVGQLRAVSKAAELAADGYESNNDHKAIAGSVGVAMMWDQLGGELREVIEETLESAARAFAAKVEALDIDLDDVEIPDTADALLAEIDGNDPKENI